MRQTAHGLNVSGAALEANRLHMSYGEYMRMKEE